MCILSIYNLYFLLILSNSGNMFYTANLKCIITGDQCQYFLHKVHWDHSSYSKRSWSKGEGKKAQMIYTFAFEEKKKKNPNVKARKERTCIFYKHTAFWKGKLSPRIHTLSSALFYKEGNYKDWGITTCCFTSNHQFIGPVLFCTCWVNVPRHAPPP